MIDHLSFYATDFAATRRFYEAALRPLGFGVVTELVATWDPDFPNRRMVAFGPTEQPVFWLMEERRPASPRHIAFVARSPETVKAFYRAALEAGGRDNGPPGPRPQYAQGYYAAFVFDPDGNNVEAVCHEQ